MGGYTNLNEMKINDQFIKVISHYLNPNINEFMKHAQEELNFSLNVDMPKFEGHGMFGLQIMNILHLFPRTDTA